MRQAKRSITEARRAARRGLVLVVAAVALAAAAGCMSVEEEINLAPDGSVQYVVDFTMLEMVVQGLAELSGESPRKSIAEEWIAGADSTKRDSIRHREFADGKDHHFVAERTFASLEHLASLSARAELPDSERAKVKEMSPELPLGGIQVSRLDARRVRLRRVLESPSPTPPPTLAAEDDSTVDSAKESGKRMFADRVYVFRLRAPGIESANGVIAADRKSVEWRVPMTALMGDSAVVPEAILVREKR